MQKSLQSSLTFSNSSRWILRTWIAFTIWGEKELCKSWYLYHIPLPVKPPASTSAEDLVPILAVAPVSHPHGLNAPSDLLIISPLPTQLFWGQLLSSGSSTDFSKRSPDSSSRFALDYLCGLGQFGYVFYPPPERLVSGNIIPSPTTLHIHRGIMGEDHGTL